MKSTTIFEWGRGLEKYILGYNFSTFNTFTVTVKTNKNDMKIHHVKLKENITELLSGRILYSFLTKEKSLLTSTSREQMK